MTKGKIYKTKTFMKQNHMKLRWLEVAPIYKKDELRWMKCALETDKYMNEGESLDAIGRLPKGEKKCKKKKEKKKKITAMKNE